MADIMQDYQSAQVAFQTVNQFGEDVKGMGQTLTNVHEDLQSSLSEDDTGFGAMITGALSDVCGVAGKVFTEGGRVLSEMGLRGKTNTDRNQNTDQTIGDAFKSIHDEHYGGGTGDGPGGSGSSDDSMTGGRAGTQPSTDTDTGSGDLDGGGGSPTDGQGVGPCGKAGEPVDVVAGQYLIERVDVSLPGVLPLVLRRAYASGYAGGRLFGPGFSSTLDTRVQIAGEEIRFADDDCRILVFPRPERDEQPVISSAGPRLTLTTHQDGGAVRVHDRLEQRTFEFAGPDAWPAPNGSSVVLPLAAITDRAGSRIEIVRDLGAPVQVRHTGGYRIAVASERIGRGLRVTGLSLVTDADADGDRVADASRGLPLASFEYDERGRLVAYTDGGGVPLLYEWDAQDRICAWTDRTGHQFRYRYDAAGRVVAAEGDTDHLTGFFEYRPEQRETVYTDSLGARTIHRYDADGRVTELVDPRGGTTRTTYDRFGQIASVADALGHTTALQRDERGDLVRVEHPGGGASVFEYSPAGDLLRRTLPGGGMWQYEYDAAGNLAAVVDPCGARTGFEHAERGALAAVIDPLGARTQYHCDAAGLPLAITDPLGATTRAERDTRGRVTAITDPLDRTTRFTWDHTGQILARSRPDGTHETWQRDQAGNLTAYTDPAGHTTRLAWGPFRTLTGRIDPDGARYTFEHDTELRLTKVTGPLGHIWTYEYDRAGNLVSETDFNGRRLAYEHDGVGRLVRRTNGAGQSVVLVRDARGQMTEQRVGGERSAAFEYNADGELVRATNQDATVEFTLDAAGRVTAETTDGRTLTTVYDAAGRRVLRTTPSGRTSAWQYDAAGRAIWLTAQDRHIGFGRDAAGRETHRWLSQSVALNHEWDALDRLTARQLLAVTVAAAGATDQTSALNLLAERRWTYRADGTPDSITDTAEGTRRFTLDPAGRITAVAAPSWTEQYAYDALGNLTHAADTRTPDAPTAGDRELTGTLLGRAGRTSYEYDAQGRLTKTTRRTLSGARRVSAFTYDINDRMTGAEAPDGRRWRYTYDPLGRRTAKQRLTNDDEVAEEIRFTWDGAALAEQEHIHAGRAEVTTTSWDYEPESWTPLVQDRRSHLAGAPQELIDRQFHAIVTDLLGTPTELVAPDDGSVAWRRSAGLWGQDLTGPDGVACPLRFPGQYHDPETGLDYNLQRYYDPDTGRYTAPDPLGLTPAPNHHSYVDNPLTWLDPFGLTGGTYYRGSKSGQPVTFTAKPNEYRVDPKTGLVKPTHGVSLFDNEQSIASKGFKPNEVDPDTVPDTLQIKQRGADPKHFEIMPADNAKLNEEQYQNELAKIRTKPPATECDG